MAKKSVIEFLYQRNIKTLLFDVKNVFSRMEIMLKNTPPRVKCEWFYLKNSPYLLYQIGLTWIYLFYNESFT